MTDWDELSPLEIDNERLRAEREALRAKAEQLSEAVWAMLKYMGDDDDEKYDPFAPDEWNELAGDVRAALARIDAALKASQDDR